jgi:hypothetical protein
MDVQTLFLWVARLACPLAIGVMMWLLFRQSNEAPEEPRGQRLRALHDHRAALEAEIEVLESQTGESALPEANPAHAENLTR